MSKGNPVGWFEIYVQDMNRAKKFYESVFQRKLEKLNSPDIEMWSFKGDMNSYGCPGSLVKMNGVSSGGNSILVYFHTEDCAVEEKRVGEFGGKVLRPKMSIGEYGFITLATDTEGNTFGIHSMK